MGGDSATARAAGRTAGDQVGSLRADARLNRSRILLAARDVFVEQGANAPLEVIAGRAGTGIGTLYRRFPDRRALMRAVVLDALERTATEAERAATEEAEPFAALIRYMNAALSTRIGAVIPVLMEVVALDDEEILRARDRSTRLVGELIDAAHRGGALRPDVTFGDVAMLLVRLSRPLPGPFSRQVNDQLARRHLEIIAAGLRAVSDQMLSGPALTLHDLRALGRRGRQTPSAAAGPPVADRSHRHA